MGDAATPSRRTQPAAATSSHRTPARTARQNVPTYVRVALAPVSPRSSLSAAHGGGQVGLHFSDQRCDSDSPRPGKTSPRKSKQSTKCQQFCSTV